MWLPGVEQDCEALHLSGPWGGGRDGCSSGTHAGIRSTSDPVIFLPKGALDQFTEPTQGLIHHLSELLTGQPCNSWERDGIWAGASEQMGEGGQGAGGPLNKSPSCIQLAVVWNCTSSKACVHVEPNILPVFLALTPSHWWGTPFSIGGKHCTFLIKLPSFD